MANNSMALTFAYSSLLVEERVETFVYDVESLMTSIGGNLVTLSPYSAKVTKARPFGAGLLHPV
jgi:hypothetical protein